MNNKINLSPLNKSARDREYNSYEMETIDFIVEKFLFEGWTHRILDKKLLNKFNSNGFESMNILHHLGLDKNFRGIFNGINYCDAIHVLENSIVDDYSEIIVIINRLKTYSGEQYINKLEDDCLLDQINTQIKEITYKEVLNVTKKKETIFKNGFEIYPRNRKVAINALIKADFKCEFDINHPTFKRKISKVNYTEPHHLIPLSYFDKFDTSLDVEENIVSLCSNCHNQLHYGADFEEILEKLYNDRKERLRDVGIEITYEDLKKMYL